MRNYPSAAGGIKLLFIAEIVTIIGAVLVLVPVVGIVLLIIGMALVPVGLYRASADDEGYKTAFIISIVNLVVGVVGVFVGDGVFGSILDIVSSILNLAVVYYVVNTTGNLAHSMGNDELPAKGHTVWMLYLICTVASVIIALLSFIPLLGAALAIVLLIVQLVAYILYLVFLSMASKALA